MSDQFNKAIATNEKRLRFIARRYGGQLYQEDVYQEILLQLWRSFDSYRGESERATWVYRIGLNAALMWQRKEHKKRVTVSGILPDSGAPAGQCQANVLEDFFNTLNDVDSMVLMMHLDDISTNEMANILGMTTNAIYVRVNRLKQEFQSRYVE